MSIRETHASYRLTCGEDGDAMYFIVAGSVEILVGKVMNRVAVLVEKQYFGEAALLMPEGNRKRTATGCS